MPKPPVCNATVTDAGFVRIRARKARADGRRIAIRPDYQQNDYLGWIHKAAGEATKQQRLTQMLDELAKGNV